MTIDLENWQAIGGAVAIVVVAVANRWDYRRESRKTRKVAEKAVELSTPTGNGFAKTVKDSLARIEQKVDRTEEKIDHHIAAHADAEVASRPHLRRVLPDVNEL
jgi:FtsZ-interacting cell division protein ZipA